MPRSFLLPALLTIAASMVACSVEDESPETQAPEDAASAEVPAEETGAAEQPLFGSNACKKVKFRITNHRERNGVGTRLYIERAEYFSDTDDRWYTEELEDKELPYPWSIGWNENLQHVEGDLITKWRVFYKYADGGSWSQLVQQEYDTTDQYCDEDDSFSIYVL